VKTGLSIQELAAEIASQNDRKRDIVIPTAQVEMQPAVNDPDGRIGWSTDGPVLSFETERGPAHYEPTRHAHRQIADRIGIPAKYYDRMLNGSYADQTLLRENVNHWLHATPEKRLLRTFDEPGIEGVGTARAFLSDRYRPLDNSQVAMAVLPVIADSGLEVVSSDITETRMYLKAFDPSMSKTIRYGDGLGYGQGFDFKGGGKVDRQDDVVHWGISISNSEVGAGSLKVESFMFRRYCLNGLIFEQAMRRNHIGRVLGSDDDNAREFFADDTVKADDEAFFLKMRDVVTGTLAETKFEAAVDKLSESTERKIEGDPMKAVEITAKKLDLTDGERGDVLRHLIEGGDLSAWGLLNAVTRTAEDVDSYDRATVLEAKGMAVVNMTPPQWQEVATAK
jgi:hypothetical protein